MSKKNFKRGGRAPGAPALYPPLANTIHEKTIDIEWFEYGQYVDQ
jgi:hypothetical protein